jgi:hypothetical protein
MCTNMREAIPQMTQIGDIGNALDMIESRLAELEHCGAFDKDVPNTQNPSKHAASSEPYTIGWSD